MPAVSLPEASPAPAAPGSIDLDVRGWVARKRARGHRDTKRAEALIRRVVAECGWETITETNAADFIDWLAGEREEGIAGRTLNKHLSTMSSLLKYVRSVRPSDCLVNWARGIERSDEDDATDGMRFFTAAEATALLAWCTAHAPHRGDYYRFLAYTGVRRSDEMLVVRSTIRMDGVPRIELPRRTKGKRTRVVPLHAELMPIVRARMTGAPADTIFDERPTLNTLKRDCIRAGIDPTNIGFHSFRKLFGSMMAAAGVPLRVTQEAMGHSSPVLTARVYQEVEHFKTAEEIAKLPPFPDLRRSTAGRKSPIAKKTLDTAGDSADDVDAETESNDSLPTHNHNDSTGCSPNGCRSSQQRIEPFCERPVDRCEGAATGWSCERAEQGEESKSGQVDEDCGRCARAAGGGGHGFG